VKEMRAKYTKGEIGKIGPLVKDFLPSPDKFVLRKSNLKVTLSLSSRSVDFLKRETTKQHVPYQEMIRALVDAYAEKEDA
jgi:predicted DNA binding CopG/RHH family protein